MKHLKYRLLSRLGIWVTGIYENGEQVSWYMRQTPVRRLLNWVWCGWNNRRHGDPAGDDGAGSKVGILAEFHYLPERKEW
jgi:hypothetical protein